MADSDIAPIRYRGDEEVMDIDFHPTADVLAVSLISGRVEIFGYTADDTKRLVSLQLHRQSVRSIRFTRDGKALYTGSIDSSISRIDSTGKPSWSQADAHPAAVTVVRPFGPGDMLLASGDDDGGVALWDTRASSASSSAAAASAASAAGPAVLRFKDHEDVVGDLLVDESRQQMVSAGCDGTLCVYDLRKGQLLVRTEQEDDEMLSLALLKGSTMLVVGTQEGNLSLWKWGAWLPAEGAEAAEGPEYFTGHPESVDAVLQVDDDTIVTGSSDGLIRLLTIKPNKLVGILGEHGDFSVERLAWSRDKSRLASVGHDQAVRFWDTSYLFDEDDDDEDEEGGSAAAAASGGSKKKASSSKSSGRSKFTDLPALHMGRSGGGGDDDEEEDEDSLDSDDDDDDDGDMDDEDEDDDSDEDEDEDEAGGSGGGRGKQAAKPARGGAGAGSKQKGKGKPGKGGSSSGGGSSKGKGGGFFDGL